MKEMHLFAGAGGGLLASLILGHKPICAVEIDPYSCQILREKRDDGWFPGLRVYEADVRLFDPSEYAGRVDCIHAGFPCQDISVAGKQAGIGEGTRSGLYREVLRIAGIVRPRYLFLENVSAILTNGLGTVLADLAAMGYDSRLCCIRASDVGAPHGRDRWWLMADSDRQHRGSESQQPTSQGWESRDKSRWDGGDVPDTDSTSLEGQRNESGGIGQEQCDTGNPCWWEIEPDVDRVAHGVPARVHRLKGLGNAQVPIQAAVAWRLLTTMPSITS